jgi:hypothetical protein
MGIGGLFFPVDRRLIAALPPRFSPSFLRQSFIALAFASQPTRSSRAFNANPALKRN